MSFEAKSSFSIFVLNVMQDVCISVRGGGAEGGGLQPPMSEKNKYYSGKTDVPFGQRHSKKYFII